MLDGLPSAFVPNLTVAKQSGQSRDCAATLGSVRIPKCPHSLETLVPDGVDNFSYSSEKFDCFWSMQIEKVSCVAAVDYPRVKEVEIIFIDGWRLNDRVSGVKLPQTVDLWCGNTQCKQSSFRGFFCGLLREKSSYSKRCSPVTKQNFGCLQVLFR